jgi:pimeloyl-ACP methyl ester carboxylesterase
MGFIDGIRKVPGGVSYRREVVPSADSEKRDYTVDHVVSRLGCLAYVQGRIRRPIERSESPLKIVNANGFMATSDIYDDVAAKMTEMGADTAVFDTWHPISKKDIGDPLMIASMGGHRMLDIMEALTDEESENVAVGHSMGGPVAARLVAYDDRFGYWVGDASAGIEHERMAQVHIENGEAIITEEGIPIGKLAAEKVGIFKLAVKYLLKIGINPSQVVRQAYLLCTTSDVTPYLKDIHGRGDMNGVIEHENDAFFVLQKQLDEIGKNPELYNAVVVSKNTKHGHANTHPQENAVLRMDIIHQMQQRRKIGGQGLSSAASV